MIPSSSPGLPVFHSKMFVFWLLAVMTLLGGNQLSLIMFGVDWPITLMITFCCVYLCLTIHIPFRRALGVSGYLIVATLVSYLLIGAYIALVTGIVWSQIYSYVLYSCLSVTIIVATALSASAALQRFEVGQLLIGILAIQVVSCIAILLTPLLLEYFYSKSSDLWLIRREAADRYSGTFTNANTAGVVACQAVVLALSLLNDNRSKVFAGLALVLGSVAVILTVSRVAILVLILVYLLFILRARFLTILMLASIGLLVAMIVIGIGLPPAQYQRLMSIMDGGLFLDIRLTYAWPLALSQIAESPIFGHGISPLHAMEGASLICQGWPCGPHNTYLMLWREAGMIPLILLVFFIGYLSRTCSRLPESLITRVVIGWTLIVAIECMASDNTLNLVWQNFIIGLSCALVLHAQRESRRRQL